ncbi:unnamed protein product [Angiostrongylus costaricensis]|uniref:PCNA-clamp-associated factor n=1 Tax=Angiostrongylus costaricensis TaxID=334426 RepID=A0A0R3PB43_ANGCS|nr:unnamed protein product [Angiostrongylus costaricensis]
MESEKPKHYGFAKTSFPIGARKKLTNDGGGANSADLKVGGHSVATKPGNEQWTAHFVKTEGDDESSKSQKTTPPVGTSSLATS